MLSGEFGASHNPKEKWGDERAPVERSLPNEHLEKFVLCTFKSTLLNKKEALALRARSGEVWISTFRTHNALYISVLSLQWARSISLEAD